MKNDFLLYLLESSSCTAVFYLLYRLLLHRETFFGFNRAFLLLTIGLSIGLPLVELPSPVTALVAFPVALPAYASPLAAATAGPASFAWSSLVLGLYGTVAAGMLLRLAFQLWRLRKLARQGPAEVYPGYKLIRTHGRLPTFSFGRWLFWNNQTRLTAQEAQQLLQHELAHIRGRHSADVLLVEVVKAAFWFNPFLYLYGHALRAVHEYLADRQAVNGGDVSAYAHLMARQVLHPLPLALAQPFSQFGLKNRITMLRRSRSARPATWKMALGAMAVAVLSLLYACRSLEVIEPQPGSLRGLAVIAKIPQQPPAPTDQFSKALAQTLRYPATARKAGARGSVYASFLVLPDGHLSDIVIAKGVDEALDGEVLRALREVAAQSTWQPARLDGKPVERRASIPVTYSLHGLNPLPDDPNDGIVVIGYLGDATKSNN